MPQGLLPFPYEVENRVGGMTALAGLPAYGEFAHVMGLERIDSSGMAMVNQIKGSPCQAEEG